MWYYAVLEADLLRRKMIRRIVCTAVGNLRMSRYLLQDNHLLRRHIVFRLQGVEVGTTGHLLSRLRPSIPVDGTISL